MSQFLYVDLATLLDLFISSNRFMLMSLGFCMCSIMSSVNSESFISFFLIWLPFISFSCFIVVARTSKTVLNNIEENWHPCLISDLGGDTFRFSPLSMMLVQDCHIWPLIYWATFPLYLLVGSFNHKWILKFVKCFFCIYWSDHVIFILHFVNVMLSHWLICRYQIILASLE